MNSIEFAKEIVNEVNKKVKRVYWTNEEIDKYFARRSAKEKIDDGKTGFMNPCLDLTLVLHISFHLIILNMIWLLKSIYQLKILILINQIVYLKILIL